MSESTPNSITLYVTNWCPDCRRARAFFDRHLIPYVSVDIDQDPAAKALVEKLNHGNRSVPTIVFPDGSILVEPSTAQLAEKFDKK